MRLFIAICVLVCSWGWPASGQETSTFEEFLVTDPPPVTFGDAVLADFDLDNDFDLLVTGLTGSDSDQYSAGMPHSGYYQNDGIIIITVPTPIGEPEEVSAVDFAAVGAASEFVPVWKSAVAAADFNGDDYLDVALSGVNRDGDAILYVYRNLTRAGRFQASFTLEGLHSGDLDWGDSDNDGDLDLAAGGFTGAGRAALELYMNDNAQIMASSGPAAFRGVGYCALEWGDYDNDGDLDLVVAGVDDAGNFLTSIYDNDGTGQFTKADHQFARLAWPAVAWGDPDGDGDLDLLLSGARITPMLLEGVVKLYRNDGQHFVDASDMLVGLYETDPVLGRYDGSVGWADYENSGYPGMAITGAESPLALNTTQLYRSGRGRQLMKSSEDVFDGGIRGAAIWGDYDNDLDIDLLIFGEAPITEAPTIKVMNNNLLFGLRVPTPPSTATAEVRGQTVTFSWSGARDRQTPVTALTYNLRVGTIAGGSQIMASMADPITGMRRISRRGNVDHNTTWTLRNLAPGTYYWSVQVLDQTYSGSLFTPEQSFTIVN